MMGVWLVALILTPKKERKENDGMKRRSWYPSKPFLCELSSCQASQSAVSRCTHSNEGRIKQEKKEMEWLTKVCLLKSCPSHDCICHMDARQAMESN